MLPALDKLGVQRQDGDVAKGSKDRSGVSLPKSPRSDRSEDRQRPSLEISPPPPPIYFLSLPVHC